VTSENYRRARRCPPSPGGGEALLAADRVGIVTHATWAMICAMPGWLRREYEALTADSIVFYPRKLIAADGADFDRLVTLHGEEALPWRPTWIWTR